MTDFFITDIIIHKNDSKIEDSNQAKTLSQQISFIYAHLHEVMENLSDYRYDRFDALVGENLCQIRTFILTTTLNKKIIQEKVLEIKTIINCLDYLKKQPLKFYLSRALKKMSVKEFLISMNTNIKISKLLVFLYLCYVLSVYNNCNELSIPNATNPKLISDSTGISVELSKKTIKLYQKMLTKIGYDILLKRIRNTYPQWEFLIHYGIQADNKNRLMVPCHLISKIILNSMLDYKIPIFLNVYSENSHQNLLKQIFLVVKNSQYIRINFTEILNDCFEAHRPLFVIKCVGIGNFEAIFNEKYQFEKIFMSNMALHPQFTNGLTGNQNDNPYDLILAQSEDKIDNSQKSILHLFNESYLKDLSDSKSINYSNNSNSRWLLMLHIYSLSQSVVIRMC